MRPLPCGRVALSSRPFFYQTRHNNSRDTTDALASTRRYRRMERRAAKQVLNGPFIHCLARYIIELALRTATSTMVIQSIPEVNSTFTVAPKGKLAF